MIATTGFFDGVHCGHRLVIERLVSLARERGDESLVVTFWPHPRAVLQDGARELRLLTTLEEKKELLKGLGVDRIEVLDFTRSFAALTAEQFLRDILRDRFGVTTLLMGYDNRLGSDRLTASKLRPLAEALGVALIELESLSFRAEPETAPPVISSGAAGSPLVISSGAAGGVEKSRNLIDENPQKPGRRRHCIGNGHAGVRLLPQGRGGRR